MINTVYLVIRSGPLQGHKYIVKTDAPILIGRSEEANIRIAYDESCSRKHAAVYWKDHVCYIQDLHSLNGTRVNNVFIKGITKLNNKDIIGLGATEILVMFADGKKHKKGIGDDVSYDD